MDLNYLYHRRGRSLQLAALASCELARDAHLDFARGYSAQIGAYRTASSARTA